MPFAKRNIVGLTFGRIFVFAEAPSKREKTGRLRRCSWGRCACGDERIYRNSGLVSGNTESCGCLMLERVRAAHTVHGHTPRGKRTRTYESWLHLINRCTNANDPKFSYYGGKGVTVCERWRTSFANFLADMGECPPGLEIDRWPDKLGNYEPGNCRWATELQQQRNKSSNRIVTFAGVTGCVAEVCEHFGIPYQRVNSRLHRGWSVERAFTTQVSIG